MGLAQVERLWDRDYGSPPIGTPENTMLYNSRVQVASKFLRARFPVSSGDLAIFTHATTALSLAYGLCASSFNNGTTHDTLKRFVEDQNPIAPAGVVTVTLDSVGKCTSLSQTSNTAYDTLGCGKTEPYKCEFADYPAWYWADP